MINLLFCLPFLSQSFGLWFGIATMLTPTNLQWLLSADYQEWLKLGCYLGYLGIALLHARLSVMIICIAHRRCP